MIRVAIATLGCKVNNYESAGIAEELESRGFSIVPFDSVADIYIVNTCTVTKKTDYQSRQLIRRANRKNPSASIIATGCYAQIDPETLSELPGVTMVVGTKEKETIPDFIEKGTEKSIISNNIDHNDSFHGLPVTKFPGQTRAYLKVQDGCNSFCSYCIIPYARGRSRSLPEDDVIKRIASLCESGYREIVLTGIHLGIYGQDLHHSGSLSSLLGRIENETKIERLRISSIEPMEITDDILGLIKESSIICRHLHIPLQSGDNSILNAMNRNYNTEQFRERIAKIVKMVPEIGIGIDVMTGFPGEGDKEFENTRIFIEQLPVAYLHVFPYSMRPTTCASAFSGHIPDNIKKERAKILREIGREKRTAFNRRFVGKRLSVLVEGKNDRETGSMKGYSDNYIPMILEEADEYPANSIAEVKGIRTDGVKLRGKIE